VVTYDSVDDAIAYVNARPRPLALYYFDSDGSRIDRVVAATTSGGCSNKPAEIAGGRKER
jgi:acyl-CoA reductase-like NAD-dependent aldehyde dehydrogenase